MRLIQLSQNLKLSIYYWKLVDICDFYKYVLVLVLVIKLNLLIRVVVNYYLVLVS